MKSPGRWWAAVTDLFTGVPLHGDGGPAGPEAATAGDGGFRTRLSTHLLRHPGRLISACVFTVLGPAVVSQVSTPGAQPVPPTGPAEELPLEPFPVPGDAVTWVPVAVRAAATCPGLPSAVLVAIGHVESSLGLQPWASSAGAMGPMQFLPATWAAYAADGDGDGHTDVMNTVDAIHGAARFLCANGGADPDRLASALWNYNHSEEYVRQVLAVARFIPAATVS